MALRTSGSAPQVRQGRPGDGGYTALLSIAIVTPWRTLPKESSHTARALAQTTEWRLVASIIASSIDAV